MTMHSRQLFEILSPEMDTSNRELQMTGPTGETTGHRYLDSLLERQWILLVITRSSI